MESTPWKQRTGYVFKMCWHLYCEFFIRVEWNRWGEVKGEIKRESWSCILILKVMKILVMVDKVVLLNRSCLSTNNSGPDFFYSFHLFYLHLVRRKEIVHLSSKIVMKIVISENSRWFFCIKPLAPKLVIYSEWYITKFLLSIRLSVTRLCVMNRNTELEKFQG